MEDRNDQREALERLDAHVETGLRYFHDSHKSSLRQHARHEILPQLETILTNLHENLIRNHMFIDEDEADTTPEFVFHYTSIGTLVSMLQAEARRKSHRAAAIQSDQSKTVTNIVAPGLDASLRLYDSAHFNDPDDGNYLARHLNPSSVRRWLSPSTTTHAYVASFIVPDDPDNPDEASDNLVFWRTYGQEGEGCSLKLRTPKANVWRVLYNRNELVNTVEILTPVLECVAPLFDDDYPWLNDDLARAIWKSLGILQYLYKSRAYRYENECRIVVPASEILSDTVEYEFDQDTGHLRHYCVNEALEISKILSSGSSITIGPCVSDKDDLCRSLDRLKIRAGLDGTKIKTSEISYRQV